MQKFRKYLKSPNFGVLLLVGSVIVQGFHSFFVFADLSNFIELPRLISSIFYAFVLSCAILYYTMINKRMVALRFQIFESVVNLYYFFKSIVIMLIASQISWVEVIPRSIIAIGIAIILPYTIFEYAGSINEGEEEITPYFKKKYRKEAAKEILQQIKSMEDVNELNQKFSQDE